MILYLTILILYLTIILYIYLTIMILYLTIMISYLTIMIYISQLWFLYLTIMILYLTILHNNHWLAWSCPDALCFLRSGRGRGQGRGLRARSIRPWRCAACRCAWSGARRVTSIGRRAARTAASAITAWRWDQRHNISC